MVAAPGIGECLPIEHPNRADHYGNIVKIYPEQDMENSVRSNLNIQQR
jgi:hypothetical protein